MEQASRLTVIADEVKNCTACVLHEQRKNTVFHRGNPASRLVFIGEAPGANEDEQGLPFVGKAGKLLDNMIKAMKYEPDDVYVCNICKCRPPGNRKPLPEEMDACKPFLQRQLEEVKPKVIVALGATATEGLLGTGLGITKRRGKWGSWQGIDVMPTFHPSYCLRNPTSKQDVWADLQLVMSKLKEVS